MSQIRTWNCHRDSWIYETGIPGRSEGSLNVNVISVKTVFKAMRMDVVTKGVIAGKEEGWRMDSPKSESQDTPSYKNQEYEEELAKKTDEEWSEKQEETQDVRHPRSQPKNGLPREGATGSTKYC